MTIDLSSHWDNDYSCSSWYIDIHKNFIVNYCELGEPSSKPSGMYVIKDYCEPIQRL